MTEEIQAYECGCCGDIYEYKNDAEYCCRPRIEEITAYKCDGCDEIYHDEEDANYCCYEDNNIEVDE